jgi:hypothetical protein
MYRVYTAPELGMVHLARNLLRTNGIDCVVRGEHLGVAAGGVAPIDTWPELWVPATEVDAARALIEAEMSDLPEVGEEWDCDVCGERIGAQFGLCWSCGAQAPRA